MRLICKGKDMPIKELYKKFNEETNDGKNMSEISELLNETISSIINKKEENDIDSFLNGEDVSFSYEIKGLNDFELICFLIIK